MNIRELVKECEKRTSWRNILSHLHSFTDNFEDYKKIILNNEFEGEEINKFIEICDNRIERVKTFLGDVATVLGFVILAASIILPLSKGAVGESGAPLRAIFSTGDVLFQTFIIALLVGIVILFILLLHYRFHIHAWIAFKEAAILNKPLISGT